MSDGMRLTGTSFLSWVAFALGYGVLAYVCLLVRDPWSLSSFIWLPAGITLTLLCLTEWHEWPAWLVISASLHTLISLADGRPLDVSLLFSIGDVFIVTTIAVLWRTIARRSYCYSYSSMNGLFSISALVMCFVEALILYLFASLNYPVSLSHSVVWAVSEASGILVVSSYFTMATAGQSQLKSGRILSPKENLKWLVFIVLTCASYNLCSLTGYSSALAFTSVLLVLCVTVIAALYLNALHTALYIQTCALVISLCALQHAGPFADGYASGTDIFLSQVFLLFLTLLASACFARVSDMRLVYETNLWMYELIVKNAPFREFYRFLFYPSKDVVHWQGRGPMRTQDETILASSALLIGRFSEEHQQQLRVFFSVTSLPNTPSVVQLFSGDFLDENLNYVPVTLAFMPAESRYGNLRLEGVLVFH